MKRIAFIFTLTLVLLLSFACSTSNRASKLAKNGDEIDLRLPSEENIKPSEIDTMKRPETIIVKDEEGNDMVLMNAIMDDETGEMVATEVLEAATISVRFKRVAERRGKIDLGFEVVVPATLLDNQWQMQLVPELYLISDQGTVLDFKELEKITITGEVFRIRQLRSYELYEKLLKSVSDSSRFKGGHALEVFMERNMPEIYRLKYDTNYVYTAADSTKIIEELENWYRLTGQEAIDHYSNHAALRKLKRKQAKAGVMRDPRNLDGVRVDSVVRAEDGNFICDYVETIATRPKLKKALIYVAGTLYDHNGKKIYSVPRTDSLEYNISSAAQLYKQQDRYLHKIIYRRAEANNSFNIDFKVGKYDVDPRFSQNAEVIKSIRSTLFSVLQNKDFDLDSVVVTANCSPEGSKMANDMLSRKRSQSVSSYFDGYMNHVVDSLNANRGFSVDEFGNIHKDRAILKIRFRSRSLAENWPYLNELVAKDSTLSDEDKKLYEDEVLNVSDWDARERTLRAKHFYPYVKDNLYPKLRTVNFNFHLHRKGMVKDTVVTTELDTMYKKGLEYLKDRDYDNAIQILRGYPDDYNLAVCYVALDRNLSALGILENLPKTPEVNYLLALVYSRQGDNKEAVQCYLDACRQNPTYKNRGNMDPEISVLIKTYGLNAQEEIPFDF